MVTIFVLIEKLIKTDDDNCIIIKLATMQGVVY